MHSSSLFLHGLLAVIFVFLFFSQRRKKLSSNYLLAIVAMCFLIIAAYDWQLNTLRTGPIKPHTAAPQTAPEYAPATGSQLQEYYPPIIAGKPQVKAPASSPQQMIADVFNAGKHADDAQGDIDSLKQHYEQILVTYFFLKKCNKDNPADYQLIISALTTEIRRLKAPIRLQYDILTAARGSYQEIYSRNTCTPADVDKLTMQYEAYLTQLSEKLNRH